MEIKLFGKQVRLQDLLDNHPVFRKCDIVRRSQFDTVYHFCGGDDYIDLNTGRVIITMLTRRGG
jgi:hypothetical protein